MLTTRPKPACSMPGRTAWVAATAPATLTRHIRSNIARGGFLERSGFGGAGGVDQQQNRGRAPAAAAANAFAVAASSVTSAATANAAWPALTASCSGASRRPRTVTRAPAAVSAAAIARPMPVPPPVTSACCPARGDVSCRGLRRHQMILRRCMRRLAQIRTLC